MTEVVQTEAPSPAEQKPVEQPAQANASPVAIPEEDKKWMTIVYALQTAGFFVGITFIAAVICSIIKKSDMESDVGRSHMSWATRTFWWSFGWMVLAGMLMPFMGAGMIVAIPAGIWTLYRVIRGWIAMSNAKAL